jgi:hypothetical protein
LIGDDPAIHVFATRKEVVDHRVIPDQVEDGRPVMTVEGAPA